MDYFFISQILERRSKMKHSLPDDIEKCCALCEYARKLEIADQIICTRTKNLIKVSEEDVCKKFSFDLLSYKPKPAKLPKFSIESMDDLI